MRWRDAGLAAPVIEEMFGGGTPDRTILTLPLDGKNLPICRSSDSSDSSDVGERHRQILAKMQPEREYSSEEISDLVGLKGSRTRELLRELAKLEKIDTIGSTRGKRYKTVQKTPK